MTFVFPNTVGTHVEHTNTLSHTHSLTHTHTHMHTQYYVKRYILVLFIPYKRQGHKNRRSRGWQGAEAGMCC